MMKQVKIREAVGLFDNMNDLQEAVRDLEVRTFPREFISVLGHPREIEEKFGTPTVRPEKAEDDPRTPRRPLVRLEEKAIGAGVLIGVSAYIGLAAASMATGNSVDAPLLPAAVMGGLTGGA